MTAGLVEAIAEATVPKKDRRAQLSLTIPSASGCRSTTTAT